MEPLRSLIYISNGNLPSKMAHTIAVAKMGQALSQKLKDFELVTGGDIKSAFQGMDAEFQSWYGLHSKYKLVRIPLHTKVNYPFPPDYYNKSFFKLASLYACLKAPTVVYTRDDRTAEILLDIGIPVLWEQHHPIKQESPYCRLLHHKHLVGFVTISPTIAEAYLKQGLNPHKSLIAHSGVDSQSFLPHQTKQLARQKLSLPQEEKIVLYSGHLYDYKGIPTILETAKHLAEYTFVLVGGWENDINRVKETCNSRNINNIKFIGHVSQTNLAAYLYAADVLLLPTSKLWEQAESTSPLKLFEYMIVKRPIVASALPNIMSVLRDGENALLVEPDEPLAFKTAIEKLFINPALANSLGEQAFQEVQNFTWSNRAEKILQFINERLQQMDSITNTSKANISNYIRESAKRLTKKML